MKNIWPKRVRRGSPRAHTRSAQATGYRKLLHTFPALFPAIVDQFLMEIRVSKIFAVLLIKNMQTNKNVDCAAEVVFNLLGSIA